MNLNNSKYESAALSFVTCVVGDFLVPNVDLIIKIAVPIFVGITNHILTILFNRRVENRRKKGLNP